MIKTSTTLALVSIPLIASLLSACSLNAKKNGKGAVEILTDREAAPARASTNSPTGTCGVSGG